MGIFHLITVFIVIASTIKTLILFRSFRSNRPRDVQEKDRQVSRRNMVYPGLAKAGTYLSIILLISGGRYLSLSLVALCSLTFILWLQLCSKDNKIAKTIKKGRNYSINPIKMSILYILTFISVGLQPISYSFSFELHFEIFIIFIASLLTFSYFYLHRMVLNFAYKDKNHRLLAW